MEYNFESDLEKASDEMLKYVGITNLDFRTELSKDEIEEVQRMLFSINTLMQVSFKDGTRISDIEKVKHIIELSPMCDDKKVEKLILRNNSKEEVNQLLSMHFMNPETWQVCYQVKNGTYMITTLPNYRIMEEYISIVLSCINAEMSPLEKIKEVYDFVKLLELDENSSDRIPDIIVNRKASCLGYNILFREILNRIGICSYIGDIIRDGKLEHLTIVDVCDKKYDADGIYVFDPSSDSIPRELYKSDAIRKINYNFFGLTLEDVVKTKYNDKLVDSLLLLISESLNYSKRKIDDRSRKKLENIFNISYEELYNRVKKTKKINEKTLLDMFVSTVHKEDFLGLNRNIDELINNNYTLRKKEIFETKEDDLVTVCIHDI